MDLKQFCVKLKSLGLSNKETALAILWYHDEKEPEVIMPAARLAKIIFEMGLGNPNSTRLRDQIHNSKKVISSKGGFRLKEIARSEIRNILHPILGTTKPAVDQELGYLPRDVWKGTRRYIERVSEQLNGCFQLEFYDAASVLVRRLTETLIIEAFEHLGRESEIKGQDGNFLMLRDLVGKVTGTPGLPLGREAKAALKPIKELGDRAAHNRHYNAVKADLEKVQSGIRVCIDELIALADLRKS